MRLSVIIPTLNEASTLGGTLQVLHARTVDGPVEVIVADCGSSDATLAIAAGLGLRVETGSTVTTRARACNAGAAAACGDAFLFLHADSDAPDGFDRLICDALADGHVVGGAFEFELGGPEWRLRIVETVNRIRYRCRGRYFGDQGIFVRRDAFEAVGGFPDLPILEDAHLCRSLRQLGTLRLLPAPVRTSPRRFYNGGILRTLASDALICLWDCVGLDPRRFAHTYRDDNLRRGRASCVRRR